MELLTKSYKSGIDDIKRDQGVVTIAISCFDVEDRAGDVVRKGAFSNSFANMGHIRHVVDHYHDLEHVIGTPRKGWETDQYALVESALMLGTSRGHDMFEMYKHCADEGAQMEHSYCYRVKRRNNNPNVTGDDIADLDLFEYSTVLAGCNPFTPLIDLKGMTTIDQIVEYQSRLTEMLRKCDFTDAGGRKVEELAELIKSALRIVNEREKPDAKDVVDVIRGAFNNEITV